MANELARVQQELENRVDPTIVTTARPTPERLLQARADIGHDGEIRQCFLEELTREERIDRVGVRLSVLWGEGTAAEAHETAEYLVDEFQQLGSAGAYLVSTETGKVVTVLTSDDFYQPASVPREHGGMATPLPRLKPGLQGLLITWTCDRRREEIILERLTARSNPTELLKLEGDARLKIATKAGRKNIVESLKEFSPKTLLKGLGGPSGVFLECFEVQGVPPTAVETAGLVGPITGKVVARSVMGIQDLTTSNLHYNRAQALRGVIPHNWVREIVRSLAEAINVEHGSPGAIPQIELRRHHFGDDAILWAGPPELFKVVKSFNPSVPYLASDRSLLIGLMRPKVGILEVAETFETGSFELFDRWEAAANLEYRLWFDPEAFKFLPVGDLVYEGTVEG